MLSDLQQPFRKRKRLFCIRKRRSYPEKEEKKDGCLLHLRRLPHFEKEKKEHYAPLCALIANNKKNSYEKD